MVGSYRLPEHVWSVVQRNKLISTIDAEPNLRDVFFPAPGRTNNPARTQHRHELCLMILSKTEWMRWMKEHDFVEVDQAGELRVSKRWKFRSCPVERCLVWLETQYNIIRPQHRELEEKQGMQGDFLWRDLKTNIENKWYATYYRLKTRHDTPLASSDEGTSQQRPRPSRSRSPAKRRLESRISSAVKRRSDSPSSSPNKRLLVSRSSSRTKRRVNETTTSVSNDGSRSKKRITSLLPVTPAMKASNPPRLGTSSQVAIQINNDDSTSDDAASQAFSDAARSSTSSTSSSSYVSARSRSSSSVSSILHSPSPSPEPVELFPGREQRQRETALDQQRRGVERISRLTSPVSDDDEDMLSGIDDYDDIIASSQNAFLQSSDEQFVIFTRTPEQGAALYIQKSPVLSFAYEIHKPTRSPTVSISSYKQQSGPSSDPVRDRETDAVRSLGQSYNALIDLPEQFVPIHDTGNNGTEDAIMQGTGSDALGILSGGAASRNAPSGPTGSSNASIVNTQTSVHSGRSSSSEPPDDESFRPDTPPLSPRQTGEPPLADFRPNTPPPLPYRSPQSPAATRYRSGSTSLRDISMGAPDKVRKVSPVMERALSNTSLARPDTPPPLLHKISLPGLFRDNHPIAWWRDGSSNKPDAPLNNSVNEQKTLPPIDTAHQARESILPLHPSHLPQKPPTSVRLKKSRLLTTATKPVLTGPRGMVETIQPSSSQNGSLPDPPRLSGAFGFSSVPAPSTFKHLSDSRSSADQDYVPLIHRMQTAQRDSNQVEVPNPHLQPVCSAEPISLINRLNRAELVEPLVSRKSLLSGDGTVKSAGIFGFPGEQNDNRPFLGARPEVATGSIFGATASTSTPICRTTASRTLPRQSDTPTGSAPTSSTFKQASNPFSVEGPHFRITAASQSNNTQPPATSTSLVSLSEAVVEKPSVGESSFTYIPQRPAPLSTRSSNIRSPVRETPRSSIDANRGISGKLNEEHHFPRDVPQQ
ncbi:hypothetical protein BCR39DRAFT_521495, partial [Naematelia encephala]